MSSAGICIVGMFPPPLHGMSLITEHLRIRISAFETPYVTNLSPGTLDRSFGVRLFKLFRVIYRFAQFAATLATKRVGCVYFGVSGGNGQIYDSLFVGLSRIFGKRLYLHHHGYDYLNQRRWVAGFLMKIAGSKAVHIVACQKMLADLTRLYPVVRHTKIVSGVAALEPWEDEVRVRTQIRTIGFLSNISVEKGIIEFLQIAEWADRNTLPLRFVIAGPYHDDAMRRMVEGRIATLGNVIYVGAVYGENKRKFFDSIDVFLLPSHRESEGLVIHEAMSRGVPVIAYSRGCIEQIVSGQVGLLLAPTADYVVGTIGKINEWLQRPDAFRLASEASASQFREAKILHERKMDDLCAELVQGSPD